MASFRKRGNSWMAQVNKLGCRPTASFPTKAEAVAWALRTEADIVANKGGAVPSKTFGELLDRYAAAVSPTKKGVRWERVRIALLKRYPIAGVGLRELSATHFSAWRDQRMREVSAGTVLREWAILSNACRRARDEWGWISGDPLKSVARPEQPPARARVATTDEVERIIIASGYRPDMDLDTATSRVGAAFLFAIETAMRAGEITALRHEEVFLEARYLKVTGIEKGARKNNAAVRSVPLTKEADRILRHVQRSTKDAVFVFDVSVANLDALFRKIKDKAMITDLTFHDQRHLGITRLAQKFGVLDLARIVGHTNIKELMTYYNPTINELVGRLG